MSNTGLGLRHAIVAAAGFAVMGAMIKAVSVELGTAMIAFLRNIFGLLFLAPLLARRPLAELGTRVPGLHVLRAGLGLSAMYCFFFALANMRLAEATLLSYAAPLYVPALGWLWLRERPTTGTLPLVLIGLLGVGMIVRPEGSGFVSPVALVAAMAGVFAGGAFVAIRRLSATEPAERIVFYFALISALITAFPALLYWTAPSAQAWLLMLGVGLFATLGQLSLTRAYALLPAARVAPLNFLVVVFAMLIGWLIWGERLDQWSLLGTALVIGSGIATLRRR